MTEPAAYEYAEVDIPRGGKPSIHKAAVEANLASDKHAQFIVRADDPTYGTQADGTARPVDDIVNEHVKDLTRAGNALDVNVTTKILPALEDGSVPVAFKARRKGARGAKPAAG